MKLEDNHRNRNTIPKRDEVSFTLKILLGLEYQQENVPSDYGELSDLAIVLQNQYWAAKVSMGHSMEHVVCRLDNV